MEISAKALRLRQLEFFHTGATLLQEFRQTQLARLAAAVRANEEAICSALYKDLRKNSTEAYVTEVGILLEEIKFAQKNLDRWMRPKRVRQAPLTFPGKCFIQSEPLGSVLIIGPWNYPFQLVMAPLVGALAAGNCAVLKPSELAPETSRIITSIVKATFAPEYVAVMEGGVEVSQALLSERWDHLFFTGGTEIGRIIYTAAAKNLVPVTLELGGKSPCLIDESADLDVSARRIAWGKFMNSGQTCIAPDYLLVPRAMKDSFAVKLQEAIRSFFGSDASQSPDYGRIITDRHFDRLNGLMEGGRKLFGGESDRSARYIAPTLIEPSSNDVPLMREEIFGPILPIVPYDSFESAVEFVRHRPKPLALYFFTKEQRRADHVLKSLSFGGGCINDTLIHLGNARLPFGGVGDSGIGAYHGKHSFDLFSHRKSVVKRGFWPDPKLRYPPYAKNARILKWFIGC